MPLIRSRSRRTAGPAAAAVVAGALGLSACGGQETNGEPGSPETATSAPAARFTGVAVDSAPGSGGDVRQIVLESSEEGTVDPYDAQVQQAVAEALDGLAEDEERTPEAPLLVLNPFGTSTTGIYARFATPVDGTLTCTVSSPGTADWTRTARDASPDPAVLETQLVGAVPGAENTVTMTHRPHDGSAATERRFRLTVPGTASGLPRTLERTSGDDGQELGDGLFVLSGADGDQGATPLVDNEGVVRGEITGRGYRIDRVEFHGGRWWSPWTCPPSPASTRSGGSCSSTGSTV